MLEVLELRWRCKKWKEPINQIEEKEQKIMVLEKECLLQAEEEYLKLEEEKTEKDYLLRLK